MRTTGRVSIVGAGPGDPEFITVKALKRIQEADVILYDRLVNEELLSYAPPEAIRIYCGKAPGEHAVPQEGINKLLIRYGLQGKRVVRLKGGDPFVFGRGGEEVLALAAYGIPHEVIPGITSAIGSAASAGIPLTHRGVAASFACVTGSRCHGDGTPVRWDLLAHSVDTLVIYMGVKQIPFIREQLLLHGKPGATPVAFIERGTTHRQRSFLCTVEDMQEVAAQVKLGNPALIVVGEVAHIPEQVAALQSAASMRIG